MELCGHASCCAFQNSSFNKIRSIMVSPSTYLLLGADLVHQSQQQPFVISTTLILDTLLHTLLKEILVGNADMGQEILVADNAACQKQLISPKPSTGTLYEFRQSFVGFQLHTESKKRGTLAVATKLLLESLEEGIPIFICVLKVDHLQVLWRGHDNSLDKFFRVASEPALTGFVDSLRVLCRFLFSMVVWVPLLLCSLKGGNNNFFQGSTRFAHDQGCEIFGVKLVKRFLQQLHIFIASPAEDGVK
mmetsp:Transcript_493/g.666  ORF Transcript_493/g.666 Transcript_493/m.666 type:complete len:247 (+) Transcript_493:221-961(+)